MWVSIIKIQLEKSSSDQQKLAANAVSKLVLPYVGKRGIIMYQGTKLSPRFHVKDQIKFKHRNDIVYWCKCHENDCDDFYIVQTENQRELLITIRNIKVHILYNIHKIGTCLGKQFQYFKH